MSAILKPELSEKNESWIEKHRYYELKHFCLQYPIWKKAYLALDGYSRSSHTINETAISNQVSDPVSKCVEAKLFYWERMNLVNEVAKDTSDDLYPYILKGVTEGLSYSYLKSRLEIPCCRDVYYKLYRQFFWLLNNARN